MATWKKVLLNNSPTSDFPTLNQNTTGTAGSLASAGTVAVTGDVTASGVTYTSGGNVSLSTSLANDSVSFAELNAGATSASSADTKVLSWDNSNNRFLWKTVATGDVTGVSAGTGISVTDGGGPVPQVAVDSTVVVTSGAQTVAGNKTFSNDVIVNGNLTVSGSTVTTLAEEVKIEDSVVVLNSNETGTPSVDAGIEVERGSQTNTKLYWKEADDAWVVTDASNTTSSLLVSSSSTATTAPTGNANGVGSFHVADTDGTPIVYIRVA